MTTPQALEIGIQHHQAGRLEEAEAIYRRILAVEPEHSDAMHLLGVIAHQAGRNETAVDLIRRAIAANPLVADFHNNLGNALRNHGKIDDAITAYRRALELAPDDVIAHVNLGVALTERGCLDDAMNAYRRLLQLHPGYAEAHSNLGNVLAYQGKFDESIASFRRALELKPDLPETHSNLGNALRKMGQFDEAIAACRRAVELKPDLVMAHMNLGVALTERGDLDDAINVYRRLLQLHPDNAEAHSTFGSVLASQGKLDEAIASFRRALQLKPDYVEAQMDLGNALSTQGQLDEAIAAYRRILQFKPDVVEAHNNMGLALKELGHPDEAIAAYHRGLHLQPNHAEIHSNLGTALQEQGRLDDAVGAYRRALELKPDNFMVHSNLLLGLHYLPDFDAHTLFLEHCRWNQIHAQPLAGFIEPHGNDRNPERPLRVGYVSPDFRGHSVAFFIENLLANHHRDQVEVFCYADTFQPDSVTARLRKYANTWRTITGMTDSQVAGLIHKDGIDLLVDLAGHTAHNRLMVFARKRAPIQITYLGYPDTTGVSAMDFRLTDAHADPPGKTEHLHSEHLVRLPEISACFRPSEKSPPIGPLPALTRGFLTFGSFHTLAKLNEPLLELWARILLQVPGSRLVLVAVGLNEGSGRERLSRFFSSKGVRPERLKSIGRKSLPQYLALHNEVDVLLDSHPFSGHTVSCHALWMGVPVLTLAGDRHCARMVTSVLASLDLPELIAHTPDEYVRIACELAGDLPRLVELRSTLRERMRTSAVTDGPRFTRNVEQAYREMWREWCATQSPPRS